MTGGAVTDDDSDFGSPRPVTAVIADDQALVRGGFRLILKAAGIDVLAEAADGERAVEAVLQHQPDVVLMDIRMPRLDGIEATRRIVAARASGASQVPAPLNEVDVVHAGPRIIVLTTFDLDEYVYAALTAGASGFLLKDVTPEHLVAAVQLVRTGDALLAPSITRRLVERFAGGPSATPAPTGSSAPSASASAHPASAAHTPSARLDVPGCDMSALTHRELEVLGLIARGMSNAEIAAELFLSEATAKTHVGRILAKLSLRDRVQAVVLAYESGLVSPGG